MWDIQPCGIKINHPECPGLLHRFYTVETSNQCYIFLANVWYSGLQPTNNTTNKTSTNFLRAQSIIPMNKTMNKTSMNVWLAQSSTYLMNKTMNTTVLIFTDLVAHLSWYHLFCKSDKLISSCVLFVIIVNRRHYGNKSRLWPQERPVLHTWHTQADITGDKKRDEEQHLEKSKSASARLLSTFLHIHPWDNMMPGRISQRGWPWTRGWPLNNQQVLLKIMLQIQLLQICCQIWHWCLIWIQAPMSLSVLLLYPSCFIKILQMQQMRFDFGQSNNHKIGINTVNVAFHHLAVHGMEQKKYGPIQTWQHHLFH